MELQISKNDLNKILGVIQNVVEKRNTMPILANVLLSASDGFLKVSATDLEISATAKAPAQIERVGSTTVNAKVLCDLVRELPDEQVHLKLGEGERLEVISGKSQMRIIGVSSEEFPSLPGLGLKVEAQLPSQQLVEMIAKTIYAVSADETRFNLSGICFELHEAEGDSAKVLRMVATDGHRLAMINRSVDKLSFDESVLVPRKGLAEIKKLLDGEESGVGIGIQEGFMVVETETAKIAVRLIDGEFPDYNQVLPKQDGVQALVSSDELTHALRRVSLLVTDKTKGVRLDFTKDSLRISSSSPELGDASEEIGVEYGGDPLSIGFNAKYLLDIAASVEETTQLCIELNGELGPGKFFSGTDDSYFGIVMPMRLV